MPVMCVLACDTPRSCIACARRLRCWHRFANERLRIRPPRMPHRMRVRHSRASTCASPAAHAPLASLSAASAALCAARQRGGCFVRRPVLHLVLLAAVDDAQARRAALELRGVQLLRAACAQKCRRRQQFLDAPLSRAPRPLRVALRAGGARCDVSMGARRCRVTRSRHVSRATSHRRCAWCAARRAPDFGARRPATAKSVRREDTV